MNELNLTDEEIKILELYRECEKVEFKRYRDNIEDSLNFANILCTKVTMGKSDSTTWLTAENGKVTATSFLKQKSRFTERLM